MGINAGDYTGFYHSGGGFLDPGGLLMQTLFPSPESGRDTTGDVAAMTGKLLTEQFKDWEKTFKPIELETLNDTSFNNGSVLPTALAEAKKGVSDSYGAMGGVLERQNRSLGIEPNRQQKGTINRIMNVSQAEAMAGAENNARSGVRRMDELILSGATPNPNIAKATPGVKNNNQ